MTDTVAILSDAELDAIEATARATGEEEWYYDSEEMPDENGRPSGRIQNVKLVAEWSLPINAGSATELDGFVLIGGGPSDTTVGAAMLRAAEHIATMDPATTLRLVAEVRRLRAAQLRKS